MRRQASLNSYPKTSGSDALGDKYSKNNLLIKTKLIDSLPGFQLKKGEKMFRKLATFLLIALSATEIFAQSSATRSIYSSIRGETYETKAGTTTHAFIESFMVKEKGYKVQSISATVMAEKPKLLSFIPEITNNLASVLNLSPEFVGIGATTLEGLGLVGREEGICTHATATLVRI